MPTTGPTVRRRPRRVAALLLAIGLAAAVAGCGAGPFPPPRQSPAGPADGASPAASPAGSPSDHVSPSATGPQASPSPSATATPTRSYPYVAAPSAPTHLEGHPVVYLTYDDGPVPEGAPPVLAALARHDAVATFFVMGYLSARYPRLLRDEAAAGMAIGNHTWSHKNLMLYPDAQVRWQLRSTSKAITVAVGVAPTCLRPPYGAVDDRVRYLAQRQGLVAWLWSNDWTNGGIRALRTWSAARATRAVIATLRPGSVVLLHDGEDNGPRSAKITERVLQVMAQRGWRTATLCPPAQPGATGPAVGGPG